MTLIDLAVTVTGRFKATIRGTKIYAVGETWQDAAERLAMLAHSRYSRFDWVWGKVPADL